jgi:hypothetical protein
MALGQLKAIPKDPDLGVLEIDLTDVAGDGAIFKFREPKAADLFPDAKELGQLRIGFSEFPDSMLYQVYLLGRTYIPGPEDDGESPVRSFGNLARASKITFFRILSAYMERFPMDNWQSRVDDAKNVSAE